MPISIEAIQAIYGVLSHQATDMVLEDTNVATSHRGGLEEAGRLIPLECASRYIHRLILMTRIVIVVVERYAKLTLSESQT